MPGCDVGVQPLLLCPRSLSEDVLSGFGGPPILARDSHPWGRGCLHAGSSWEE